MSILIETPCGEGREVCSRVEELAEFINRFSIDEKKKMGLCIDTCHIFVAGYEPLDYYSKWLQIGSIPIMLTHFNDSKGCRGSKLDRHELVGQGCVGYNRMLDVAKLCSVIKIDMVTE